MKPVRGIETAQAAEDAGLDMSSFKLMKPVRGIETIAQKLNSFASLISFISLTVIIYKWIKP